MTKGLNLVFVPQEYSVANHQGLWEALAQESGDVTVVVNIGADLCVSVVKRRFYRILEAFRSPVKMEGSCILVRPLYLVRPEVAGTLVNRLNMLTLKKLLTSVVPDHDSRDVRALFYGGDWSWLVARVFPEATLFYFVLDEVTRTASTDNWSPKRAAQDFEGCRRSDRVLLMSSALAAARVEFREKLVVVGNGAAPPPCETSHAVRDHNTVGVIGNLRDWIDEDLLEDLVKLRADLQFVLVGNVEENMRDFVERLGRENLNVRLVGAVPKSQVWDWYRSFGAVIVPYKQNHFVSATRPIKIVEAVLSGTPVVTVPVDGYRPSEYVLFATTPEEFSSALDLIPRTGIDMGSVEFGRFAAENSWQSVARKILLEFEHASAVDAKYDWE